MRKWAAVGNKKEDEFSGYMSGLIPGFFLQPDVQIRIADVKLEGSTSVASSKITKTGGQK